jgi:hypothetical protein
MTEVSHASPIHTEGDSKIVVGSTRVELSARVRGTTAKGHVTTVLSEKNGVSGTAFHGPCPIDLPYGEVGVSVEAEQNARCTSGIPDHESDEPLSINCFVRHPSGLRWRVVQSRWLKEDSLL